MSNPKAFLFIVVVLSIVTVGAGRTFAFSDCNEILDPNLYPNLNNDEIVDFEDYAILATNWLWSGERLEGDLNENGIVDANDLDILSYYWLANACGPSPQEVFESFKGALLAEDVNDAVGYFVDFVADDYRAIFNENVDELQNMANDMGDLALEYIDRDVAVYEISDVAGTSFFPVVFFLDDNVQWKIAVF